MTKGRIHFVGVGGSAMVSVALLARAAGFDVDGCDANESPYYAPVLDRAGIGRLVGHAPEHVSGATLVVATTAALKPGCAAAREIEAAKGQCPVLSWQEFVARFLHPGRNLVAVCGCHGKSTTTAFLGQLLEAVGADPSVLLGAPVARWQGGARVGKGPDFLIEACEYQGNFLNYSPHLILLNNVELDHPDEFPNLQALEETYLRFACRLEKGGALVANVGDPGVRALLSRLGARVAERQGRLVTFGRREADFSYEISARDTHRACVVIRAGETRWRVELPFSEEHNVANAVGALVSGSCLGHDMAGLAAQALTLESPQRRMETRFEGDGVLVIDDYAHHPTAVAGVLSSLRHRYPQAHLVALFEPHQTVRLAHFLDDFAKALNLADEVLLAPVYAAREGDGREGKALVTRLRAMLSVPSGEWGADLALPERVASWRRPCVVAVLGAGDSYRECDAIAAAIRNPA